MGKKKKKEDKTISIMIPIETDEYLRKFILDNSHMRNKIRNDFVEEANKYKGDYNMYDDFKPLEFKTRYYNEIEIPENRYNYYSVGLSERVAADIDKSVKMIRTKNRKVLRKESINKLGQFHFKKFDYNRYSFRVKLKPAPSANDNIKSRLKVIDNYHIKFMVRSNHYGRTKEIISINLKESLYDDVITNNNPLYTKYYTSNNCINRCSFLLSDIKEISFLYECGNYYIILYTNVSYNINKKSKKYSKDRICGIDTGIRHPVTLYDGEKTMYLSMDDKTTRKIHYLERRIKRLQYHLDKKYEINRKTNGEIYSNNTMKLNSKMRKLYRKITNIKINWIKNICKQIATTYGTICVDTFEQPDNRTVKDLPKKVIHKINYANRFHSMYYFNEFLKHSVIKYGCNYIKSPDNTTRTCSVCGYINDHLPLSQEYLVCNNLRCNHKIERDMNAAKNCYYYLLDNM